MKRTISFMTGKGSTSHNDRVFSTNNIDKSRTQYNIVYHNEKIQEVYHKLFDEALENYNAKQTRKDRRIENYYKKICNGAQENPFEEIIVQIGDLENMGAKTENGQISKKILDEYMKGFQIRNPNLYVFSAHLHMDEATPHLHIDFIPFITGSTRGLETRVSFKAALEKQGFKGGAKSCTERNEWYDSEKEVLANIMMKYGIEWEQKGTHEKHKSVSEFKRQKLIEDIESLQEQKAELEYTISAYKDAEEYAMVVSQEMTSNKEFKIPEPAPLMLAKLYKTKYVESCIKRILKIVQDYARRCYRAEKAEELSSEKIVKLQEENKKYRSKVWNLNLENSQLKVQLRDYNKIKSYFGINEIKQILKTITHLRKKDEQEKQTKHEK